MMAIRDAIGRKVQRFLSVAGLRNCPFTISEFGTAAFLAKRLYRNGFLVALWSVTFYTVGCSIYGLIRLRRLYRQSSNFQARWRIGTLFVGFAMMLLYILGRRIKGR